MKRPEGGRRQLRSDYEDEDDPDPFGEAIQEMMTTAIADRASASALVPGNFVVPDDSIDKFRYMTFATPLDKEARHLREEAIRRLALGQDIPPEVLLGVGGMNHWGAWLIREDTVKTHVEPQLATMCDSLTTQYLWPVLEQQNMDEKKAQKFVIWYDVDHLIARPNRLEDAIALHHEGAINDKALRDAGQFGDTDAQVDVETSDEASSLVLKMVQDNPSLIRNPGIEVIVEAVRSLLKGDTAEAPEVEPDQLQIPETVPPTNGTTPAVPEETGPPTDTR